MTRASTPVSADGNSIQFPLLYKPPHSTGSFFHVIRKRLTGSTSHKPTFFSRCLIFSGTVDGSRICANVGSRTFRSRNRSIVRDNTFSSTCMLLLFLSQQL